MRLSRLVWLGLAMLMPSSLAAQDAHYWNLQYGPVAELLGGNVVGSALDLSATYYNPGGLALAEDDALLLALDSFQLEQVKLQGEREFIDLSSTRFGSAPSLFATRLPRWGESHFAFSFLTRQDLKLRVNRRRVIGPPEVAGQAGTEALVDQSISEHWGGLTWSRHVSERAAFGATLYGVFRSWRERTELNAQVVTAAGDGFTLLDVADFSSHHARLLMKLGFALDRGPVRLGLAVTTPSLGLFGSGKGGYTRSLTGVDLDGDGVAESILANAAEEDLAAEYRSPLSISAGASWRRGASRFHASAEWFDKVDRFDVVDPTPFESDPAAEPLLPVLRQELKSVINVGLGVEHTFSEDFSIYGAFTTDFSASTDTREVQNSVSTWDIYHITAGSAFRLGSARLTLGLAFAFGNDSSTLGSLPDDIPIVGGPHEGDLAYRRYKVLIGFAFGSQS